jgi:hypothetical protein
MKGLCVAIFAITFMGLSQARPVVIEQVATLTPPDPSWTFFGRIGVAIDGDFALVSGERFVEDPHAEGGIRHDGAALLYGRSGTSWNYLGPLGPIGAITEWVKPGLAMKDGVAMVIFNSTPRIFERTGTTWTQAPFAGSGPTDLQGPDIEIDAGRILVPRISCYFNSVVLRKISGTWSIEGELTGGNTNECGDNPPTAPQDMHGGRAIIYNAAGETGEPARAIFYRANDNGVGWMQFAHATTSAIGGMFGPEVAMNRPFWAVTGSRQSGTNVGFELDDVMYGALAHYGLQPVDGYMTPDTFSSHAIERYGSAMFAQANYSIDRAAYVVNVFRMNDDPPVHSSEHVATLQARSGASMGSQLDASGIRIIVSGRSNVSGHNTVRIFELPASFDTPAAQVHDFESSSAGAAWQPTAGSSFSIVRVGHSLMYRQAGTVGNPASFLPTSFAGNQAIQSEVTIRSVAGADRWAGLATRRADDANYYYVTLRTSGSVQLKRMVGGVFTTLAAAPATVTVGRKYRLRLESIGSAHRVYLDDRLVLTARDAALSQGTAGVIMYRASADYDNVIVTPSPFTTIYKDDFSTVEELDWQRLGPAWQPSGGVYRQSSTLGLHLASVGSLADDQIVRARIRPTSFAGPDNWVGLMARARDADNFLYVSLRRRGVISLWRRANGDIVQLATRALTVTPGTWYDVRIEVVNQRTRVFVNDQLYLVSNADPGPAVPGVAWSKGKVGLVTYKATADFDDFLAYQP